MELSLTNKALKTVIEVSTAQELEILREQLKKYEFYKKAYENIESMIQDGVIDIFKYGVCDTCFCPGNELCYECCVFICEDCNNHKEKLCSKCDDMVCTVNISGLCSTCRQASLLKYETCTKCHNMTSSMDGHNICSICRKTSLLKDEIW